MAFICVATSFPAFLLNPVSPSSFSLKRERSFRHSLAQRLGPIRSCAADAGDEVKPAATPSPAPSAPRLASPEPSPAPAAPSTAPQAASFTEIFSFAGQGPELINGRLAMLGFVGVLAVEAVTGLTLEGQLSDKVCFSVGLFTLALFTVASVVPMFRGVKPSETNDKFFTFLAEKWNGRLAMLGLVWLVIQEFVQGSPLL
eukprot:TRINITY_DN833_c0_g1_i1.p2 TRINITY_DN833_c0_g1~~TRINITY_DN833_c0_g1_i1.p2  ORF type:complete len:210 (+),score=21.02 TRINITY_DN833_c0_g1_i1:33-632(+)